jgi:PAS domain S-box-containing protein
MGLSYQENICPKKSGELLEACRKNQEKRLFMGDASKASIQNMLLASECRLRSIFLAAPVGIGVVVERVIKDTNDRLCEMTGYSRDELIGKNARIFYPTDDDYNYVGSEKYRQIAEKGTGSVETRWRRKDGMIINVLLSSTPIDQSDLSAGVTFTAMDITERKKAEQISGETERRYRTLFEGANDAIFIMKEDRFIECNHKTLEMFGCSDSHELVGHTPWEFSPEQQPDGRDSREKAAELINAALNGKPQRFYWKHLQKNKTLFDAEVSLSCFKSENKQFLHAIVRDITERKLAEEALENERMRFKIITQNAPFGILLINEDGKFKYLNPKFTEIFGYDLSDVPDGKSWFNLAYPDPEYRKEVLSAWIEDLKASEPGEKRPRIYEVVCKDGSRKIIHFIPVSLKTGENIIACEDITERTTLENQLRQAQKLESVGRLAGGVAHDFNNMLQAIIGYAELAMMKIKRGSEHDEDLIQISQAAQRAADLTRQLLAFARKQPVSLKVLDLNKTVASMLEMLNRIIGEDIELIWKPSFTPYRVKMDPAQIDQILANLLVNSRDAIAGVGKVIIETGHGVFDEAYCRVNPGFIPGEYALLEVSDTGSGMDKETVSQIFEPFFTTKEVGKGTGLGLAMVYGIVKQNNGIIKVISEPGHGTTFKIYLPSCQNETEIENMIQEKILPDGNETILVVEDEKMLLEFITTILQEQGYKVLAAETPENALRMACEHKGPIHLLITDVVMPGMNGREVKDSIVPLYPEIKVIYMSGYTADILALKGIMDEGTAFLRKPFTIDLLSLKVRELLEK